MVVEGRYGQKKLFCLSFQKWENVKGKDFTIEQEAENPGERKEWDHNS